MGIVTVSVVIINYNTFRITCDCLQSVYAFTKDISFEVILVDNASVECDAQLFKQAFPELMLVKSDVNLGFAGGNNLGIRHSTGRFILLLNSDTILTENCIKHTYEKFKTFHKPGFVGIKNLYPGGEKQFTCVLLPSAKNLILRITYLTRLFKRMYNYTYLNKEFSPEALFGSYLFFDRNLLTHFKDQKLNELFFIYHEDLLWCWEARKAGFRNYFIPSASIIHLVGASRDEHEVKRKKSNVHEKNFEKLERLINGRFFYPLYKFLKKLVERKEQFLDK